MKCTILQLRQFSYRARLREIAYTGLFFQSNIRRYSLTSSIMFNSSYSYSVQHWFLLHLYAYQTLKSTSIHRHFLINTCYMFPNIVMILYKKIIKANSKTTKCVKSHFKLYCSVICIL